MAHLERDMYSAGYLYNPFTTMDAFGRPAPFNFLSENHEMELGQDTSAIAPAMDSAGFDKPQKLEGSSVRQFHRETPKEAEAKSNGVMLLVFGAIVAFALWRVR